MGCFTTKNQEKSLSVSSAKSKKEETAVKKPISNLRYLKYFILIGYFYDFGMILLQIAHVYRITYQFLFEIPSEGQFLSFEIIEAIYIFDILLRQIIDLWRYYTGNLILILPLQYTCGLFTLDCISIFPCERILLLAGDTSRIDTFTFWLGICQLNRIFRLGRLRAFLDQLSREIEFDERFLFLVQFICDFFFIVHALACIMYAINLQQPLDWALCYGGESSDKSRTWLINRKTKPVFTDKLIPLGWDLYLYSLNYVISCLTTVGFGDTYPESIPEQLFALGIMLLGAIYIRGVLASHLTTFHLDLDEPRFDLFFRLNAMMEFLQTHNSHRFFDSRVRDYYQALWNTREGNSEISFDDSELPIALVEEIAYDLCYDMFAKTQLLYGLEAAFLKSVAVAAQFVLYSNGVIIFSPGKHPGAMYYLVSGELIVRSRYDESIAACILSPGCVIGECLLLYDIQALTRVEAKGECSLLRVRSEDLDPLFEEYPHVSAIIRARISKRFNELTMLYCLKGKRLVRWVEKSNANRREDIKSTFPQFVSFRKTSFFGTLVTDETDLLDDTRTLVCYQTSGGKTKDPGLWRMLEDVAIPFILSSKSGFVATANALVVFYVVFCAISGPYCYAYLPTLTQYTDDYNVCPVVVDYYWIFLILNFFDFCFEVLWFSNYTSWYDRLKIGFRAGSQSVTFWFDVLCILPIDLILTDRSPLLIRALSKLHKVFRVIKAKENHFPLRPIVFMRLLKATCILIYTAHFVACILFSLACPHGYSANWDACGNTTWIDSYKLDELTPPLEGSILRLFFPYLISLHFAMAQITGVGYGDFNPKSQQELLHCSLFMILGLFLTVLCTASLTSGFASGVRPKLVFEQRLLTIRQFMDHHHLHERLQSRVAEHYQLQHQLIKGVSLPHGITNMFFDSPDFISKDKDWLETDVYLQGVPLFTKADASTLTHIGKSLTRYLLPPEIIFLHRGEVRRQMYIIGNGSVAMVDKKSKKPHSVYESTAHFGIRDLLFGEPAPMTVKTLSYVLLFVLDFPAYEEACADDAELLDVINKEAEEVRKKNERIKRNRGGIDVYEEVKQEKSAENVQLIENWIVFDKEGESGLRYSKKVNFEETYDGTRFPRFFKYFLLRRSVHPSGQFAKWWTGFISIVSMTSFIFLTWELFLGMRQPWFRFVQFFLDACHLTDLYIKLHWGYYADNNLLICHPVKTAIKYIWDGSFLYDMLMCVPIELITWFFGKTNFLGYGPGYVWYSKLRWNRGLQIYKVFEIFSISRGVFTNRITSLITLYLFTTISIGWILSGAAMYLSCPSFPHRWEEGDEYKLPACIVNTWSQINQDVHLFTFSSRLWSASYYVLQVMLGVGYGDLVNITDNELIFLLILSILGFFIVQLTLADLTAAQVDSDEIRGVFLESRNAIVQVLKLANASPKFIQGVNRHFKHTWTKSKGLQPRTLFEDLHPALEADLFREFVGDQLSKVPLFKKFSETEVRTLCQYMRKEYFIKGERMSRAGNLEFQMFIIVDGEVFVASKKLEWECTLRKNEFFGEISMLYGLPRTHNAFAARDVEVFVLDADDFATMLDRYPTVRERMIETLGNSSQEYFVKKVERKKKLGSFEFFERAAQHTDDIREFVKSREVFQNPIVGLDDEIFEIKVEKPIYVRFITNIWGRGTLDNDLPFFYLATNDPKNCNFLIHPKCNFMIGLDIIYKIVFFISPLMAQYKVVFLTNFDMSTKLRNGEPVQDEVLTEIKLSIALLQFTDILECIMILRILISLCTPFLRDDGTFCKTQCRIAQRYLTSSQFLVDWLTTTPYSWILPAEFTSISHRFTMVRYIRIIPFLKAVAARSDDLDLSSFRYKLILSCTCFFLLIQFSSGHFFQISCPIPGFDTCIDGGWVERAQHAARIQYGNNLSRLAVWNLPSRHYFRSLYWVIVTVTTCGFGDIVPHTLDEMCFTVILFLVGTFSLAVMLGNITTGLATAKKGERDFLGSIRTSVSHLRSAGLSGHVQSLLMAYFDRMWLLSRGVPFATALRVLPLTMQIDASTAIYSNILRKCKFFGKVTDFTFIRAISIHVTHAHFLPGDRIVSEGEFGANLYIAFKGEVGAYVTDEETGELIYKKSYRPEEAFGKVPALFLDAPYNKTYRSEGYSEVLIMHQHDIMNISSYYAQWREHLSTLVEHRYANLVGLMDSIFYVTQSQKKEELILTFTDLMKDEEDLDPLHGAQDDDDDEEGEIPVAKPKKKSSMASSAPSKPGAYASTANTTTGTAVRRKSVAKFQRKPPPKSQPDSKSKKSGKR